MNINYKDIRYFLTSSDASLTGALTVIVKLTLYFSDRLSSLHKNPSNSAKSLPAIFVMLSMKMWVIS